MFGQPESFPDSGSVGDRDVQVRDGRLRQDEDGGARRDRSELMREDHAQAVASLLLESILEESPGPAPGIPA